MIIVIIIIIILPFTRGVGTGVYRMPTLPSHHVGGGGRGRGRSYINLGPRIAKRKMQMIFWQAIQPGDYSGPIQAHIYLAQVRAGTQTPPYLPQTHQGERSSQGILRKHIKKWRTSSSYHGTK